jgi:hypothetical protein
MSSPNTYISPYAPQVSSPLNPTAQHPGIWHIPFKHRRGRAVNEVEEYLRAKAKVEYAVKRDTRLGESSSTPWLQCQMPPGRKPGVHKAAGVDRTTRTEYTQNSKIEIDANDPGNAADFMAMEELDIANLTLWGEAGRKMAEGISLSEEHIDIEGGAIRADETDGTGDGNGESASTTTKVYQLSRDRHRRIER